MTFHELAVARYSVRKFSDRLVETDKLHSVLESGRVAPTARNSQSHRFKIMTSGDDLAKVDECTPCRYGAPLVILICYDKTSCYVREYDNESSGVVDSSIVTTHLMLAAQDLGLGTCWVMRFDPARTVQLFGLHENLVPMAFLPIGYPAEDCAPSDRHAVRLSMDELIIT